MDNSNLLILRKLCSQTNLLLKKPIPYHQKLSPKQCSCFLKGKSFPAKEVKEKGISSLPVECIELTLTKTGSKLKSKCDAKLD